MDDERAKPLTPTLSPHPMKGEGENRATRRGWTDGEGQR